jgi:hypothetical protein
MEDSEKWLLENVIEFKNMDLGFWKTVRTIDDDILDENIASISSLNIFIKDSDREPITMTVDVSHATDVPINPPSIRISGLSNSDLAKFLREGFIDKKRYMIFNLEEWDANTRLHDIITTIKNLLD